MKKLFFTTTCPRHPYKSEKFFYLFQRLRYINFFGRNKSNNRRTFFKRMLVLKRFFMWYYSFMRNRHFFRLMRQLRKYSTGFHGIFYNLLQLLELHLHVLLIRAFRAPNLVISKNIVDAGLIMLNGDRLVGQQKNFFIKLGSIVEIHDWQIFLQLKKKHRVYCRFQKFFKQLFGQFYPLRLLVTMGKPITLTL
jgi:hypothetical protein